MQKNNHSNEETLLLSIKNIMEESENDINYIEE